MWVEIPWTSRGTPRLVLVSSACLALARLCNGYSSNFFLQYMAFTKFPAFNCRLWSRHSHIHILDSSFASYSFLVTHPINSFSGYSPFIPILAPQDTCLGVQCPYPARCIRLTARLVVSMGRSAAFPTSGPPICLERVVGIGVFFSQEVVSPLSHYGGETCELGFDDVFVVCLYQSVWLDLGYLVSHFQIRRKCIQNKDYNLFSQFQQNFLPPPPTFKITLIHSTIFLKYYAKILFCFDTVYDYIFKSH